MKEKYTITDLQNVANQRKSPPPCDETMQVYVQHADSGSAYGIWKVDGKFINGHGIVMGGFVSAAADIMMAYAIASTLAEKEGFASIDLDTTFHRPTVEGEVNISAKVERRGKTIAYVTAEVKQKDKLVANCVSSLLIIAER